MLLAKAVDVISSQHDKTPTHIYEVSKFAVKKQP